MGWKNEFPHMANDMPADIPAEWIDISWHNDSAPSFVAFSGDEGDSNMHECRVWIAESDSAQRDWPDHPRFAVTYYPRDDSDGVNVLVTDSWSECRAYVERRRMLGAAYVAAVGHNPFLDCPAVDPAEVESTLAEFKSMA